MIKRDYLGLLGNLLLVILGGFLVIKPEMGLAFLLQILAVILLVVGVIMIVRYFKASVRPSEIYIILSSVIAAGGLMLLICSNMIARTLLPVIIGFVMLMTGIVRLGIVVNFRHAAFFGWWVPLIGAVIAIILGVLVLTNTGATSSFLSILVGLFMLISGIMGLLETFAFVDIRKKKNM